MATKYTMPPGLTCPNQRADGSITPHVLATPTVPSPPPVVFTPVDYANWPAWAKTMESLKADADKGVGDTVKRLLGKFGEVYQTVLKKMGMPCGCNARRDQYNIQYPYDRLGAV